MSSGDAIVLGSRQAADAGDLAEVAFSELVRAPQVSRLQLPLAGTSVLPLGELDPEVLERLAAEMIKRRLNEGSCFYGRRGQKQYGLDIVEREVGGRVTIYQVRRHAALTPAKITAAVTEYAGPSARPGAARTARRFAASKYVLLTSASFEDDTALRDRLGELEEEYEGDLILDVWGRERVSAELRDSDGLVKSVFGAEWAREFCGFDPPPPPRGAPDRLGLVEDPVSVLEGLDALAIDALAKEAAALSEAARLYGVIADTLAEAGFPAHAAAQRARQGHLLKDDGDAAGAFAVLWELARSHLESGESTRAGSVHIALDELRPALGPAETARLDALQAAQDWYEQGCNLPSAVPALETLRAEGDPQAPSLTCIVLEQALADGWYDFDPPAALVDPGRNTRDLLDRLAACAAGLHGGDPALRARLHCACADALVNSRAAPWQVKAAFGQVMRNTGTGRYRKAEGLAAARAARAFALHGDPARAIDLWRTSVLLASESGLYGDVLACRRAISSASLEKPAPSVAGGPAGPLPNEDRMLAAAYSAQLRALAAVHAGNFPDAFGAARRWLWEARTAGQLRDERAAMALFGDIMLATGRPEAAVVSWVAAGSADKAGRHAAACPARLDMGPWAASPARHRQAAAARVIGAQARHYAGADLERAVRDLLSLAAGTWSPLRIEPNPPLDAVTALCRFGRCLPASAVDPVLELLAPSLAPGRSLQPETTSLLIQVYWAVPGRRDDLAAVIAGKLRLADPPPQLWDFVGSLPLQAREPLAETVTGLAEQGDPSAVLALAAWQVPTPAVQLAARRAVADVIRQPPPSPAGIWSLEARYSDAAVLAAALASAGPAARAEPRDLRPGSAPPSRTLGTMSVAGPAPARVPAPEPPGGRGPAAALPDWVPDQAAITAAGPPAQVIAAAARQFLSVAGDRRSPAFARVDALHAIRLLVPRMPPGTARESAGELLRICEHPDLNEFDQAEILTQDLLSRGRLDTGAAQLPALALLVAAEAAAADGDGPEPAMARRLVVRAAPLLRSPDPDIACCAAAALARVAGDGFASALITQPLDRVREVAAALAPLDEAAQQILAADPAPGVRAALAARPGGPSPETLRALLADPHPDVAQAAAFACPT